MEPQIRYCTTSDGASIAYATMGAGPAVVVPPGVHSFSGLLRVIPGYRAICAAISAAFTLVQYDGRGMGLSGRDRREYDMNARLLDLDAVVRAVGAETFALYGSQFGGLPAMAYTARHPDRVTSLVLYNSFSSGERFFTESAGGRWNAALESVTVEQWESVSEAIAARSMPADAGPDYVRDMGTALRETWEPADFLAHRQAAREIDVSGELAAISVPTLVVTTVTATGGAGIGAASRELATTIPNARLIRVTSRWAGWDERDYATLVAFLSEHTPSAATADAPTANAPAAPTGMVVVLFTDIVDSTALTERLGDAAFRTASRALDEGMRAAMREAGGTPVEGKVLGDGVMGVFTSASQAIDAARRCIELSAVSELQLHVGLHAGDVIHEKGNVYGGAVNIASRVCGLSAPGEVLVSDIVRGLAGTSAGVEFEDRGEQALKGIDDAVRVYEVRWRE